jgi:hypothetical protein
LDEKGRSNWGSKPSQDRGFKKVPIITSCCQFKPHDHKPSRKVLSSNRGQMGLLLRPTQKPVTAGVLRGCTLIPGSIPQGAIQQAVLKGSRVPEPKPWTPFNGARANPDVAGHLRTWAINTRRRGSKAQKGRRTQPLYFSSDYQASGASVPLDKGKKEEREKRKNKREIKRQRLLLALWLAKAEGLSDNTADDEIIVCVDHN